MKTAEHIVIDGKHKLLHILLLFLQAAKKKPNNHILLSSLIHLTLDV